MLQVPSRSMKSGLEEASNLYESRLPGSVAEKYLSNRGITKEAMTYFRLGFVGDDPFQGHEFKEGRLSIPYITPSGIVTIRFRAIPEDGIPGGTEPAPKMLSLANSGTWLYNTRDMIDTTGIIGITEGEPDAWTVHMLGIPVVAIPGAKAWEKLKVASRAFRFRKAIIFADNDDHGEGKEFAEKVQADLRGSRICLMPEGHDTNSFANEYGLDALKEKAGL